MYKPSKSSLAKHLEGEGGSTKAAKAISNHRKNQTSAQSNRSNLHMTAGHQKEGVAHSNKHAHEDFMAIVDLKNLKTIKSEVIYTSTDSNGKSKATTPTMAGKKGPKPLMQLSQSNLNLKNSNFNQPKTTKAQHSVNVF